MSKVSKLFDSKSKEYDQIYGESKKLLHKEKRVRAVMVEDMVLRYLSPNAEGVLLDVGCGMGHVILNLKEKGVKAKMYGVDISPEMINLANKKQFLFDQLITLEKKDSEVTVTRFFLDAQGEYSSGDNQKKILTPYNLKGF